MSTGDFVSGKTLSHREKSSFRRRMTELPAVFPSDISSFFAEYRAQKSNDSAQSAFCFIGKFRNKEVWKMHICCLARLVSEGKTEFS
jgi:hypothetical protein